MIQVKEITKFFGKKPVVQDVSVDIVSGKITSFIGPNGAGKSTLLSMVSRLLILAKYYSIKQMYVVGNQMILPSVSRY